MHATAVPPEPPDPTRLDAFVSYAHADREWVSRLAHALRAAGRSVWKDADAIPPAAPWRTELGTALEAADAFVFVISERSLRSRECRAELDRAVELGKRLLPVLLEPAGGIPESLAARQFISADGDVGAVAAALARAIDTDHDWVREHTVWLARALRWEARGHDAALLPRGRELAEAKAWLGREAEGLDPRPTALQSRFIATAGVRDRRRRRTLALTVSAGLVIAVGLVAFALTQRDTGARQRDTAQSRSLAAESGDQLGSDADAAGLLGAEAMRVEPTVQARAAALRALWTLRFSDGSLLGHRGTVTSLAVSGRTIASGSADGTVRLWDRGSRRQIGRPLAVGAPVFGVAFAGGGLTTLDARGRLRVWDLRTRRPLGAPLTATAARPAPAFAAAPDGRAVAAAGQDGVVDVWNLAARTDHRARPRLDHVAALAYSPGGRYLAAAGADDAGDAAVSVLDARTLRPVARLTGGPGILIEDVAFSRAAIAASDAGGAVRIWATGSWRRIGPPIRVSASAIKSVAFAPGGRLLATAGQDGAVRVYSLARGRPGETLGHDLGASMTVVFTPDGTGVVSGGADAAVHLWRIAPRLVRGEAGGAPDIQSLAAVGDGAMASAGGRSVVVSRVATGATVARLRTSGPIEDIAYDAPAHALAIAESGALELWDLRRPSQPPRRIARPLLRAVAAGAQGQLVTAEQSGAYLWAPGATRPRRLTKTDTDLAAFDPDGRSLALATGAAAGVYDVVHHRFSRAGFPGGGPIAAVALSPDGRTLATSTYDGVLRLWDWRAGRALGPPLESLHASDGEITGLAFDRSGDVLAASGPSAGLRLFDVASRSPLEPALGYPSTDNVALAFSPPSGALVTSASGGGLLVWNPVLWSDDRRSVTGALCDEIAHDLTAFEWRTLAPGLREHSTCGRATPLKPD